MEKIQLTDDQLTQVAGRTAVFITKVLEAYNLELSSADRLNDPVLEANAAIRSLAAITTSVISSICQDKESLLETLASYTDVLKAASLQLAETKDEDYRAAQEVQGPRSEEVVQSLTSQLPDSLPSEFRPTLTPDVTCGEEG